MTRWRRDVERVNRLLRPGLTFYLEPDARGKPPGSVDGGVLAASGPGETDPGRPEPGATRCDVATGVLVVALNGAQSRSAACSIRIQGSERGRRLSIARGFSECAMALGLGLGVYRGHQGEPP